MKIAVIGLDKCTHDGGKSLKGIAHPGFQGKGRSKHMPIVFRGVFDQALTDPDLLDLSADVATQEAIIVDLLGSLEEGEAPTRLVGRLRSEWRSFWVATGRKDQAAIASHREQIRVLLGQAATAAATIDRIMDAQEQKRKLVDTEDKRRERRRNYITAEQANFLRDALAMAVKNAAEKYIEDDGLRRKLLNAIAEGFIRIAGRPAVEGPPAGD